MTDLETWFKENKREFPWREQKNPYAVWISEVMLQQTRASVVIPYFERWMRHFPDVKSLYKASIDEVIKLWEGLGYYSRARNLHKASQEIVHRFSGQLPDSLEDLLSLPGFGPYTAAAVLNFGFHKRAAAVDGNVLRVMARYEGIEERIDRPSTRQLITQKVEGLLDLEEPWVTSEALIELGAMVCLPSPRCGQCPLRSNCRAFAEGKTELLPIKKEDPKSTSLFRLVFIFEHEGSVLIQKQPEGKVMAGLYEFPYVEVDDFSVTRSQIARFACEMMQGACFWKERLRPVTHTFTRYKAHLLPCLFSLKSRNEMEIGQWVPIDLLNEFAFSSGHKKISSCIQETSFVKSLLERLL